MTTPQPKKKNTSKAKKAKAFDAPSDSSKIYKHFRALGLVSDGVPFSVQSRGPSFFLTCSIGKSFHIYNADNLGLLFVGPDLPGRIKAIVSHQDSTFVAIEGGTILSFERALGTGKSYSFPDKKDILKLEVLGDNLLVLREGDLSVLPLDLGSRRSFIEFAGEATFMLHPHTYLNKVIIGFSNGTVELWNFRSGKLIHTFKSVTNEGSAIKMMSQAPVLDIVALGFEDGQVMMIDLKGDSLLFGFKTSCSVTGITFRSDLPEERAQMAVTGIDGQISIWDLEKRNLWRMIPSAHVGGVASTYFLPGQPILMTSGLVDNSVKSWILEGEEFRLLKSRSGHSAPPRLVRFHEEDGFGLISGGGEGDKSVRYTSLLKDSQCHELSQGSIDAKAKRISAQDATGWIDPSALKLPPITGLAFFGRKDLKWDNLVTCHENLNFARTWRSTHKVIGAHKLKSSDGATVTAVAMSSCGNFALIGSSKGTIDIYNIQSGILRKTVRSAEVEAVKGLAVDAVNGEGIVLFASSRLVIFDFSTTAKNAKIVCEKVLSSQANAFCFNPDNGLAAIALDAGQLVIFDVAGRRIVRHFRNTNRIRDLSFSPDGKSLISGDESGIVATFDLPSGLLVDSFKASNEPIISLCYSPTGQFIATAHQGDLAIHLWSNNFTATKPEMTLVLNEGLEKNLDRELVRLSSLPRSKWTQLLHLDSIKSRNRVLDADKPAARAPFFLDAAVLTSNKRDVEGERVPSTSSCASDALDSPFEGLLNEFERHQNSSVALDYFKVAGNTSISFSIYSLKAELIPVLLRLLLSLLKSHQDFEMVQTLLKLALSAHQDALDEDSKAILKEIEEVQLDLWEARLEPLFQKALCLTSFCKDRF